MAGSCAVRQNVIAIDLGGTKIAAALVDAAGNVLARDKAPSRRGDVQESIAQILGAIGRIAKAASTVDRICIVVPGIYFAENGHAWAPNLWGKDPVPLRRELETRLTQPIVIDSDRAGYVLGEQWLGAARGLKDVVFLGVGTGIGAGILADGKLVRGAGDIAGAAGWLATGLMVHERGKTMGSLESEAAGPAVARSAAQRIAGGERSLVSELCGGKPESITAEIVVEAARRRDPVAVQIVDDTVSRLAMGIANIVSLLNPEMIVLGGGLMQAGDLFLGPIRKAVPKWAQPRAAKQVRIEVTQLGDDAGLLGAARLALLD